MDIKDDPIFDEVANVALTISSERLTRFHKLADALGFEPDIPMGKRLAIGSLFYCVMKEERTQGQFERFINEEIDVDGF